MVIYLDDALGYSFQEGLFFFLGAAARAEWAAYGGHLALAKKCSRFWCLIFLYLHFLFFFSIPFRFGEVLYEILCAFNK